MTLGVNEVCPKDVCVHKTCFCIKRSIPKVNEYQISVLKRGPKKIRVRKNCTN
jgi:hypothetical protein